MKIFCRNHNRFYFHVALLLLVAISILSACGNDKRVMKEKFARKMARETCQEFSEISSGIVGGVLSGIANYLSNGNVQGLDAGALGELPANWCDCYTYFVTLDLSTKFNEKELMEINRDNIKKIMVITKIIDLRQEDMKQCIKETTNEIAKDYGKFAKELDDKFKNN